MSGRKVILAAALLVLIQASARAADAALEVPASVVFEKDLVYSTPGGERLELDLARPKDAKGLAPAIVCIHGGGFRAGNRQHHDRLCVQLAERGYVAATVTYRLAPKHQFPAAVNDVKAAVRWLRANAAKYGIDPERIGATGDSAGGHLALMLGLTGDVKSFDAAEGGNADQSSRVSCVVDVYGPSDFTKSYDKSVDAAEVLPLFLGGDLTTARRRHILASPLYWVTPHAAPTLAIHGTKDPYVAHEQAVWLIDRLKAAEVEAELLTMEGAGHGFKGDDAKRAQDAMFAFFDKHLQPGTTEHAASSGSEASKAAAGSAGLPRSTPEAQGVSSAGVLEFVEGLNKIDASHSFMLVRHGQVVAEGWWAPYHAGARHSLYSLSKSFTSTAVGLAIDEGKLSVDDEVLKFFPDAAPDEPSKNLKAMRVSDLLRMSTGHQSEPPRLAKEPWTKTFLAHDVPFKPGTHFLYNTSATYMQSAIVQKATGQNLLDYLAPRLFAPLGIEGATWEISPEGIATGGYGLSIRTEDIAKFGQLYLQKGKWQGKQLVPESWIEQATARQTSNGSKPASDWEQGYGYQFWRCRHGAYRGDGAFGQFCVVLPEQDAVIAMTSGVKELQPILDLAWDKLLPAMKPEALAADEVAAAMLREKLSGLSVRLPANDSEGTALAGKTFVFPPNNLKLETIALTRDAADGAETLVATVDGIEQRIACGRGKWQPGEAAWGTSLPRQPVAAAGGWSNDEYTARLCFYETPFIVTLRLKFAGDEVRLNSEQNVAFLLTKWPELVGKVR